MLSVIGIGHALMAIGMAALGFITLRYKGFALVWQPVPNTVPGYDYLVIGSGVLLILLSIATLVVAIARPAAMLTVIYFLSFWVLPQAIHVAENATSLGRYVGCAEALAVTAGSLQLYQLMRNQVVSDAWLAITITSVRRVFGIACVVFGISHFLFGEFTATMIPGCLPAHLTLVYLTGGIHFASGTCLLLNVYHRFASVTEAVMMTTFVVLIHLPSVGASPPFDWAPNLQVQVTALFWATLLTGAAWVIVQSGNDQLVAMRDTRRHT